MSSLTVRLLEQSIVYRLWQAPFCDQKFAPVVANNELSRVRRVLDVGCGPGTNAKYFAHTQYLGVDINEKYIQDARQRYKREFVAADVRTFRPAPDARFDFVLVNSLLHHLNTDDVKSILTHLNTVLTEDGHVHLIELVMPPEPSISQLLARWDRGKFCRPEKEWRNMFSEIFQEVFFQAYPLTGAGLTLWNMVYFKGKMRK